MSEATAIVRCMAVAGNVWSGPQFCGFKAKGEDANGRPCCGVHLGKQEGIAWEGERGRYPHGPGGRQWRFRNGAQHNGNGEGER